MPFRVGQVMPRRAGKPQNDGGYWALNLTILHPDGATAPSAQAVDVMPEINAGLLLPVCRLFKRIKKSISLDDSYWFLNISN